MDATESGSRPIPDPTLLTTQQLLRELAGLRELLETRINGMATEINLIREEQLKVNAAIDLRVDHLKRLVYERFDGIQIQFSDKAIAINKSEQAITKQLDQVQATITMQSKVFDDKLAAVKDLITLMQGSETGRQDRTANSRANLSMILSGMSLILLFLSIAFNIYVTK